MKDFFDTWKFKILVAVAVFLVGIMAYAGANGRLTAAPQELLGVILTPFQKAAAVVSGGVGAVWEKYTSIDEVMEQNEQLEAENAELRQQMVDYDRIKAENDAYKALANIQEKNSNATYVSGFVIGRDPLDEFGGFTLDKGTADGVAVNDAVISDRGGCGAGSQRQILHCGGAPRCRPPHCKARFYHYCVLRRAHCYGISPQAQPQSAAEVGLLCAGAVCVRRFADYARAVSAGAGKAVAGAAAMSGGGSI